MRFENSTLSADSLETTGFDTQIISNRRTKEHKLITTVHRVKGIVHAYDANIERKYLNNNGQNQFSEPARMAGAPAANHCFNENHWSFSYRVFN